MASRKEIEEIKRRIAQRKANVYRSIGKAEDREELLRRVYSRVQGWDLEPEDYASAFAALEASKGSRLDSEIRNLERRLSFAGIEFPTWDELKSGFVRGIDKAAKALDFLGATVRGGLYDIGELIRHGDTNFEHLRRRDIEGKDILAAAGLDPNKWYTKALGVATEVALDPLTYLSFGGSAVLKAGAKEGAEAAARRMAREAVQAAKPSSLSEAKSIYRAVYDNVRNARLAEEYAERANRLLTFGIPFTRAEFKLLDKPSFLRREEKIIGSRIDDILESNKMDRRVMEFYSKTLFDKDDITKLTTGEVQAILDLRKHLKPSQVRKLTEAGVKLQGYKRTDEFSKLAKILYRPSPAKWVAQVFSKVRSVRPDSAAFAKEGKSAVADADLRVYGAYERFRKEALKLQKELKLNKYEAKLVPYVMEATKIEDVARYHKDIANALAKGKIDMQKVENAAQRFRQLYDESFQREVAEGLLQPYQRIQNYFPHIRNYTEEELKEIFGRADDNYMGRQTAFRHGYRRDAYQTLLQADAHAAELRRQAEAARAAGRLDEAAQLQRQADTVATLFERDPFQAYVRRMAEAERSRAMRDVYAQLQKFGLMSTKPKPGYVEIKNVLDGKTIYVHAEVAETLRKVERIFVLPDELNKFVRFLGDVTSLMKTLMTVPRPAHHVFNFVGSAFNNFIAGVTPRAYAKAVRLLAKWDENDKIVREAWNRGVITAGHLMADFRVATTEELGQRGTRLQRLNERVRNAPGVRQLISAGTAGENLHRLALFVHTYDRTGSFEKAADAVRKYLFNYHELTPTERTIRAIVPFYTWLRNNIALQLETILKRPGFFAAYLRAREEAREGQPLENAPDYTWAYVPVGNYLWNPRLPIQDIEILGEIAENPIRGIGNQLSPLITVWPELAFDRRLLNDAPINMSDPLYALTRLGGIVGQGVSMMDKMARGEPIGRDVLGLLIGKPVPIEPDKWLEQRKYQYLNELIEAKKKAEKEGKKVPTIKEIEQQMMVENLMRNWQ